MRAPVVNSAPWVLFWHFLVCWQDKD